MDPRSGARRVGLGSPRLELGIVTPSSSPSAPPRRRAHYHLYRPKDTLALTIPFTSISLSLSLNNAFSDRPRAPQPFPELSTGMLSPRPPAIAFFSPRGSRHYPRSYHSRSRSHSSTRTRIPAFYLQTYYALLSFWRRTRLARTLLISAGILLLFFRILTTPPSPPKSHYQPSRIPVLPIPLDANPSGLGARGPLEPHTYLPSGLVVVNPQGRHPIYELIERAQREWEEKTSRASKTLAQAAKEYQRRYGRWPPRGFDKWWAYVERHNVQLPDEYDQILADLAPYYAYSPRELRQLLSISPQSASDNNSTFTLSSSRLHSTLQIARAPSPLAKEQAESALDLLTGDGESWMPDPGYVDKEEWEASMQGIGVGSVEVDLMGDAGSWEAVFTAQREPKVVVSQEWEEERRKAIKSERFMRLTGRYATSFSTDTSWPEACPATAELHTGNPENQPKPKSFVYSPLLASSPCSNPSLIAHSPFLNRTAHANMSQNDPHTPLFSTCKASQVHGDILVPDGSHWVYSAPKDVPWKRKKESRLIWRGRPSGEVLASVASKSKSSKGHNHKIKRAATLDPSSLRTGLAAAPPVPKKDQVLLPSHPSEVVGEPVKRLSSWLEREMVDGPFPGWEVQKLEVPTVVEETKKGKKDDWRVLAKVVHGKVVYVNETEALAIQANTTSDQNMTSTKKPPAYNTTALEIPTEWALLERNNQYKYMLDIDDQSCSPSFRHLLATGALVLKTTAFEEWYGERIQPWLHYVPVQLDLSDLYDVLSFFRGDVANGGEGEHDELAQEIAGAGKDWAGRYWRREDMTAYIYRLFLEYGRLMSDDRDKMNFYMTP
ncbi:hypothetical protein DACRYDRAFT_110788 [Dacryopinax primogenitus]|uniref:Glycosyl transferase CAP10 domain-containing protein n=1 Tax=Dacryopinax primogenitus (strain DJM 731) TaxID=1858805 RepID=M5FXT8_DACPD|nr:uncharacterized protein DACRYDRAFT_110788 [Dacryopinax primogenitus]EJT98346.1 hypothetical protein DACRYDRAFT_110788 [Dacryopinax primogenitus]